jgi:hypothetical protein
VTERQLQDAVIEAAKMFGWLHYHTHDSRRSAAGFPDLVLARRRDVLFVELKSEKGRLRPEQEAWMKAIGSVFVWRPQDWTSGLIVETLL